VKGPASLTSFLAVPLAACLLRRSVRPILSWPLLASVLTTATALGVLAFFILRANHSDETVKQDFSEFTWSASRLVGTALLIPAAFIAALPASFALLGPLSLTILRTFGKRRAAASTAVASTTPEQINPAAITNNEYLSASALALSWLLAIALLMLVGIS